MPTRINRKTKRALASMFRAIDDLIRDARARGKADHVLAQLIAAMSSAIWALSSYATRCGRC